MSMTSYSKGIWAEWLAIFLLWGKGYRIVKHRYKTKLGEIDIIAKSGNTLRFIEVKARASEEEALNAITPRSRQRIIRTAQYFIQQSPEFTQCEIGFDVIIVLSCANVKHIRFAFGFEDFT